MTALKILQDIISEVKKQNKTLGFTTGCFDLLHPTHVKFLNKCKNHCDYLIVAVSSDTLVKKTKDKNRPILIQQHRKYMVENIRAVDYVYINNCFNTTDYINNLNIDVFLKGGNNMHELKQVEKLGIKTVNIKGCGSYSTTKIIDTIKNY
jgi:rfaE bifunctional protein nucleotidyltransferase chain/domain